MNKILLVYKDKEKIEKVLSEEATKTFLESISKGMVFYNEDNTQGFWTNLNELRAIYIYKLECSGEKQDDKECTGEDCA